MVRRCLNNPARDLYGHSERPDVDYENVSLTGDLSILLAKNEKTTNNVKYYMPPEASCTWSERSPRTCYKRAPPYYEVLNT